MTESKKKKKSVFPLTLLGLMGAMFLGVFLLVMLIWGAVGYVGYKTYKHVDEKGLKGTVERVWEGPEREHNKSVPLR